MQAKFTPKFKAIVSRLEEFKEKGDLEGAKEFFSSEMLKLGPLERIQNLYSIKDKSGRVVQFKPNKTQLEHLKGRSGFDLICKSRQIGWTTLYCIYYYDKAIFDKWDTGIMSHKQTHVKLIFEKVRLAHELFQKEWGPLYPLEDELNNTTRLSWSNTKSSMTVAFDFQGVTVKGLHVSEAGFIPSSRLVNSLQAVPDDGEICLESTPNGRGGFFYDCYQDYKKNPKSAPFKGHFYPWYFHYPEDTKRFAKEKTQWDVQELELKERFDLEDYHLAWRRYCIRLKCNNSVDDFNVQYPSDDITCWLSGENQVFQQKVLKFQETFVTEPKYRGYLQQRDKHVIFTPDVKGPLLLWDKPKDSTVYVGGADPSGGHGSDPGCAIILDARKGEQVAELVGYFDPDLLAEQLYLLGHFFNQCFWCIEANNHGTAVILQLRTEDLNYPNLYKRYSFDSKSKSNTQFGFYTTTQSKITITDNAGSALRDGEVRIRSNALLSELSTFVNVVKKSNDGTITQTFKRAALPDCHDDRVIAFCLAYEQLRSRPVKKYTQDVYYPELDMETGFPIYNNDLSRNDFIL